MNVAVVGASNKPERYSYKAIMMLKEYGHTPFPVHPGLEAVEGIRCFKKLSDIPEVPDTITIYLSPKNQKEIAGEILASGARRVIFNPGTENPELENKLKEKGIETVRACTLVLLRTGQF